MTGEALSLIQQSTLADAVTERLRAAIISGQLAPGEHLAENILASRLGVSRSPVREALQRLEREGLVVRQTNRGSYVWQPTEKDVDEIFSLRTMLEILAAEWIVDDLTDEDFKALEQIIEREREVIEAGDALALIEEDKRFHEYLCRRAGHGRLLEWWEQIMGQWAVLIYRRLQHNPEAVVPTVLTDHRQIMELLRRRDLQGLIQLHRSINQRVIAQIKEAL